MTTPSTSQSQLPPQKAGPMDLIAEGLAQNSTAIVQQGLDIFASCRGGLDYSALYETLTFAVGSGKPDIVRYLLDRTDAKVEYVSFEQINMAMSTSDEEPAGKVIEVMEVLVEKGWDINRSGRGG